MLKAEPSSSTIPTEVISEIKNAIQELEAANSENDPALKLVTEKLRLALSRHSVLATPAGDTSGASHNLSEDSPMMEPPSAETLATCSASHVVSRDLFIQEPESTSESFVPTSDPHPADKPSSSVRDMESEEVPVVEGIESALDRENSELRMMLEHVNDRLRSAMMNNPSSAATMVTEATQTSSQSSSILESSDPPSEELQSMEEGIGELQSPPQVTSIIGPVSAAGSDSVNDPIGPVSAAGSDSVNDPPMEDISTNR